MGRSGTTLLDRLLGQVPGFVSVGELRFIVERGLVENQLCGCERRIRECPFWQAVFVEAFGGMSFDSSDLAAFAKGTRTRHIPAMLAFGMRGILSEGVKRGRDQMVRLYEAILAVSGREVVVDSSKYPTTALALGMSDDLDLRLLHVVRDPRAVANSWAHPKIDRNLHQPVPMKSLPLWVIVPQWDIWNGFAERVGGAIGSYLRLRYEDLVAQPAASLQLVLRFSDLDDPLTFLSADSADVQGSHMISGNPSRFDVGRVQITEDSSWKGSMSVTEQRLASILSVGWRRHYGYP
jgi:hypothetical protein